MYEVIDETGVFAPRVVADCDNAQCVARSWAHQGARTKVNKYCVDIWAIDPVTGYSYQLQRQIPYRQAVKWLSSWTENDSECGIVFLPSRTGARFKTALNGLQIAG